jgi:hypothetical protein
MIFNFFKKIMNNYYDINFQFNSGFYKICISYNVIHDFCITQHLNHFYMLDKAYAMYVYDRDKKGICIKSVKLFYTVNQ